MVRFLRDVHMSNALECNTNVLMIMMHRTCASSICRFIAVSK